MIDFHLDPLVNPNPTLIIEDPCIVCGLDGEVRRQWDGLVYCWDCACLTGAVNDPGGVDVTQAAYERWGFKVYKGGE